MIQGIKPTSKATLKLQCLFATKGDIDEAKKLYDFFAEDIPSLPDFDPSPTTWVDSTKQTASDFFSWIKNNQNAIATGYEMVRQNYSWEEKLQGYELIHFAGDPVFCLWN